MIDRSWYRPTYSSMQMSEQDAGELRYDSRMCHFPDKKFTRTFAKTSVLLAFIRICLLS